MRWLRNRTIPNRGGFWIRPRVTLIHHADYIQQKLQGSDIEWSKDPSLDRFRRSHDRVTSAKPLFIDIVISEITRSCGKNRISAAAADLIIKVNSEISISRLRRKMHGTSGLSPSDSKSYRTKVYAAAALHIKRSDGQTNTAHRVSTEWGINH